MAVRIRLARHGRKAQPFYRLVAADGQMKRDGRYLEQLGHFNPLTEPATVKLNEERVKYWLGVGASASDTAGQIIEKAMPGLLSGLVSKRVEKIRALRAKRKANAPKSAGEKSASLKPAKAKPAKAAITKQ